ncbi:bis-aminopropyl spermidine synthase family protein [Caldisericum exile]|nr:bis-aminopropyl spermidine synthase family protein [Caldisericum exile]
MDRTSLQILRAVWKKPLDVWELVIMQDNDIKNTYETLNSLKDKGLIEYSKNKIKITEKGIDELIKENAIPYIDTKCEYCRGKIYDPKNFKEILDVFKEIFANRPMETTEFDQGVVSEENSVRRLEFVYERGDLEGREIFFLGDDDLTSIVFALSKMPKRVVVFDVDRRIIEYIKEVSKKYNLNIEAYEYNASNKLDEKFVNKFDTFLTDPVETVKGMRLFLSRCVQSLKGKGAAGYFGLSHFESSLKKWYEIERDLLEMNLVITDMLRDFNEYLLVGERILHEGYYVVEKSPVEVLPPTISWYRSTFIRVELIDTAKPKIVESVSWDRSLYFDDETYVVRP